MNKDFWKRKKVLITGHTGFKGSWLGIWLKMAGAELYGYSLKPPTEPSLFNDAKLKRLYNESMIADIRDFEKLKCFIIENKPEIIIHMAAQPLVRDSYIIPRETYQTNVLGTVNLLEVIRLNPFSKVILNVTTDKVYDNKERLKGYKETDPLGGYDPYSSSKACSELVTSAYRNSFFSSCGVLVSTARAGNVIGGGDWSKDRLIPDILRAVLSNRKVLIRSPHSIRPWQHILESLNGYLLLCEKMFNEGDKYVGAWNFGPDEKDLHTVEWVVKKLLTFIPNNKGYKIDAKKQPYESKILLLNPTKAKKHLGWRSKWSLEKSLQKIAEWFEKYRKKEDILKACQEQISEYEAS